MTALTSALFRLAALIWLVTPVTVLSTWERAVLASTVNDEVHDQHKLAGYSESDMRY